LKKEQKKSSEVEKKEQSGEVTRRDFLVGAGTVVVGGAIGAGLLSSCNGGETVTTTVEKTKTVEKTTTIGGDGAVTVTATETVGSGQTVTTTSTVTVGSTPASEPVRTSIIEVSQLGLPRANTAAVDCKNGKIVRIRPLHYDWKYSTEEFNPDNASGFEARGKSYSFPLQTLLPPLGLSYKKRVYSPNRIRYPLQRVDWAPGGGDNVNPQSRGKSKYKRISWDDATTIIADEVKRIQSTYGPESILVQWGPHGESKAIHDRDGHQLILEAMNEGGWTKEAPNPDSWEGWAWGGEHMWGMIQGHGKMSDTYWCLPDVLEHSEMVLFWGCDIETTTWGWTGQINSLWAYWMKDAGIKFVHISPDLNYANAAHPDKWIPVLPNTDAALHLAISYVWFTEDTYDKDYVESHTVGMDKYKAYVMGEEDGIPKTPAWASGKCHVPSYTIKALAREWASKITSISHCNGGSMQRGPYATEPARLEITNLALQAVGKPGAHQITHIELGMRNNSPFEGSIAIPSVMGFGLQRGQKAASANQLIAKTRLPQALLGETVEWYGLKTNAASDQFNKYTYPAEGYSRVHMMWNRHPSNLSSWNGGNKLIEALHGSEIEFFLVPTIWMEDDALYADMILPVSTIFEIDDISTDIYTGQYFLCYPEKQCIEHIGESMSDMELNLEIAKKLGDDVYNTFSRNGITVDEMVKEAYEGSGIANLITWEDFNEKGYYVVPVSPEWKTKWKEEGAGWYQFYLDPANKPVGSPSGLIEIEASGLLENFPDDKERPPVPHWIEGGPEWFHDERVTGERAKNYPLLIVSNHPKWRVHSEHDDIPWLREIPTCKVKGFDGYMYEPLWINPVDATARGIENGDIVKIYNERGAVLGGAIVWDRIIPGAVYQDHGARLDEIIPGELDRGGSNNLISPLNTTSPNAAGQATGSFLVEIEKVTLDQMDEWRKQYPDAFNRDYDPAYGTLFNSWIEGGID
jgi:molybdopterin guanine dinucleotide-containing S/N-oxide reductase-like protein